MVSPLSNMEDNMAVWNQRTLTKITPTQSPEISFYYMPLKGEQQSLYRSEFSKYGTLMDLSEEVLRARLLSFSIKARESGEVKFFTWPDNVSDQDILLSSIPDTVVVEVGAAIMGWLKTSDEEPDHFFNRIVEDLRNSMFQGF